MSAVVFGLAYGFGAMAWQPVFWTAVGNDMRRDGPFIVSLLWFLSTLVWPVCVLVGICAYADHLWRGGKR